MSEQEMFKQMEMGQLLAEDVLPKVAKEYAKVARENGALDAAVNKVNSQYQRFLSALTRLKVELFEGGFGKAMGESFGILAGVIKDNMSAFKMFGNIAAGMFQSISAALWVLIQPLRLVGELFNLLPFGQDAAVLLGWAAGITVLVGAVRSLAAGLAFLNIPLMITTAKILAVSAAVLALVQGISYLTTGKTVTSHISGMYNGKAANQIAQQVGGGSSSSQTVNVVVEPNERGFNNLIAVHVKDSENNFSGQLGQAVATV